MFPVVSRSSRRMSFIIVSYTLQLSGTPKLDQPALSDHDKMWACVPHQGGDREDQTTPTDYSLCLLMSTMGPYSTLALERYSPAAPGGESPQEPWAVAWDAGLPGHHHPEVNYHCLLGEQNCVHHLGQLTRRHS